VYLVPPHHRSTRDAATGDFLLAVSTVNLLANLTWMGLPRNYQKDETMHLADHGIHLVGGFLGL